MHPPSERRGYPRKTLWAEGRKTSRGSATIDRGTLFDTGRIRQIDHKSHNYALRTTRNTQLILTK